MSPRWRLLVLVVFFGFLASLPLLISLSPLGSSAGGYTIYVATLAAILTLFLSLLTKLKPIFEELESNGGVGIGIMVDSLLASNIDSLLNRYTLIWESHGQSLSQDLARLVEEIKMLSGMKLSESKRRSFDSELEDYQTQDTDTEAEDEDFE